MAKFEKIIKGSYHEIIKKYKVNMECYGMKLFDYNEYRLDDVEITMIVYKKFYTRNLSRAILNMVFIGKGDTTYITAIIYGGGQGIILESSNGAEEDMLAYVQKCFE